MKQAIFLILPLLFLSWISGYSQNSDSIASVVSARDTAWKAGGTVTATFSQAYFDNWSAGGEKSLALNSRINLFSKYQLNKVIWQNNLDLAYGFTNQKSTGFKKNDDLIEFTSLLGYQATEKWYYSVILNIKTQFSKGYDYTTEPVDTISNFLSPLTSNLALGMTYKPNEEFAAFLSPSNLKLIYVNDSIFSIRNSIEPGENLRTEFGFIVKILYKKEILENINFLTRLDIFYDYLEPMITMYDGNKRAKSPYVSWEVLISMKVFKALAVNLNTHLIYDENFRALDDEGNAKDSKIQFKEVFGIGLAWSF